MPLDQLPGVPGGGYEAKIQHWRGFQTFCRSDYLRETTPARTRAVVTADRDLAGRVQEDGAMVMTPIELGVWLETVN